MPPLMAPRALLYRALSVAAFLCLSRFAVATSSLKKGVLPSYYYSASIGVEPFEFYYGIKTELNCTISVIDNLFFYLLEFYIHSDAPFACRLPARPPAHVELVGEKPFKPKFIPFVFAFAGILQLSYMHISTYFNVLLHSIPKHYIYFYNSGVLNSGTAYNISPLSYMASSYTRRFIIGDFLLLSFNIRYISGHIYASTVFYAIISFIAGVFTSGAYFFGAILLKRMWGKRLRAVTPLKYRLNGKKVGNR
ncbi:hypothetical protein F5Y14DRAFT_457654 [Nemania sp. NC0429]|nr:hypothetical protein F5Y14DRAFT_457654 [Nemania sp. NC0429]